MSLLKKLTLSFSLLSLYSLSQATSFYVRPMSEVTKTIPNIVYGVFLKPHTDYGTGPEGGKTIYTFANLTVKEVIKGDIRQGEIIIRRMGGTKDGVTLDIPSSVDFIENEEAVLFLGQENDDHSYEVQDLELGKFGIKEENGEKLLTGGLFTFSKAGDDLNNPNSDSLKENMKPWTLKQLKELIEKQTEGNPTPAPTARNTANGANSLATPSSSSTDQNSNDSSNPNSPSHSFNGSHAFRNWTLLGVLVLLGFAGMLLRRRKK